MESIMKNAVVYNYRKEKWFVILKNEYGYLCATRTDEGYEATSLPLHSDKFKTEWYSFMEEENVE